MYDLAVGRDNRKDNEMELVRAFKNGHSIRITIPTAIARALEIKPGTLVRIELYADDGAVIVNADKLLTAGRATRRKK